MSRKTPIKTARQLRAEWQAEIARREAEIAAVEREEARRIDQALRRAGRARVAAVETLYELLSIDEEITTRTRADGTVQTVRQDRDESERAERLVRAVEALLDGHGGTRSAPAGDTGAIAPLPPAASEQGEVDESGDDVDDEPTDPHERGWSPAYAG